MVKYLLFIHRIIHGPMVEIRIILSEAEYAEALKAKGTQHWRDILLKAINLESEKRRGRGRPVSGNTGQGGC